MSRITIVSNIDIFRERSRRELVEHLVGLGHEVLLIAPVNSDEAKAAGWPCRWLNWPLVQHGTNPLSEIPSLWFLYRSLVRERPDVVLNYRAKSIIYGTLAARAAGLRDVNAIFTGLGHYFVDDARTRTPIGRLVSFALKFILRLNRTVFFQNTDDMALFLGRDLVLEDQAFVLPGSGINIEEFSPRPKPDSVDRFVLVSRLLRDKGIFEFCEAARAVKRTHPAAHFVLAGSAGSEPTAIRSGELDAWIRDGSIDYLGEVGDVRPLMASATAVVLPSYYSEGVPRSLLEALAMGRPAITTDMPGCRMTVVDGVNGYLVAPRDSSSLAAAMEKLIDDSVLVERMGTQSREMAISQFEVHHVARLLTGRLFRGK